MTRNNCLGIFGDGSQASRTMRNNNDMQLSCLSGKGDPWGILGMTNDEKKKCKEWLDCLPDTEEILLEALLKASVATASSGATEDEDPNTCVNPAATDPEAW